MGNIPQGLPPVTIGRWVPEADRLPDMLTLSLTIMLVGLMESMAIAKSLADSHKQHIDANQELLGAQLSKLGYTLIGWL